MDKMNALIAESARRLGLILTLLALAATTAPALARDDHEHDSRDRDWRREEARRDEYYQHRWDRDHGPAYRYAAPVYAPPIYTEPEPSLGISLFFPLDLRNR
jgi:hypothetical protein